MGRDRHRPHGGDGSSGDSSDGGDHDTETLMHSSREASSSGFRRSEVRHPYGRDESTDSSSGSEDSGVDRRKHSRRSTDSDDSDVEAHSHGAKKAKERRKMLYVLAAVVALVLLVAVIIVVHIASGSSLPPTTPPGSPPSSAPLGNVVPGSGGGSGGVGGGVSSAIETETEDNSSASETSDEVASPPTAEHGGNSGVSTKPGSPSSGVQSSKTSGPGNQSTPTGTAAHQSQTNSGPGGAGSSLGTQSKSKNPTSTGTAPSASNTGSYKLVQNCAGTTFFDCFDFWSYPDPTHGQVTFLNEADATSKKLIFASATSIMMKTDNTSNLASGDPRDSIRLHSKKPADINSLIVIDLKHMPWGCSTWPAFWSNGATKKWPSGGEIDIIEGVNEQANPAQYSLHTGDSGCKRADPSAIKITGKSVEGNFNCDGNAPPNTGCSYLDSDPKSYGKNLNDAGGGVYATYFATSEISFWFWPRDSVPANINSPDVKTFGTPSATWPTSSCDIEKYFESQTIIFDNTLCGDWAGNVWQNDPICGPKAATCSEYVKTASHFDEAYWIINYVKVFSTA